MRRSEKAPKNSLSHSVVLLLGNDASAKEVGGTCNFPFGLPRDDLRRLGLGRLLLDRYVSQTRFDNLLRREGL